MFKNKREIYKALAEGETLCIVNSKANTARMHEDGVIVDENGGVESYVLADPEDWEIVKPKAKRYAFMHTGNKCMLGSAVLLTEDLETLEGWIERTPEAYIRLPGLDQDVEG